MKKLLSIITVLSITTLSASAYPPPEKDDMTLAELDKRILEFDGKVVEIEITYAWDINQSSRGKYSVHCDFIEGGNYLNYGGAGTQIYFTNDKDGDALKFFEELVQRRWSGSRSSFYVLVEGKKVTAIGEKYKKSKGAYSW